MCQVIVQAPAKKPDRFENSVLAGLCKIFKIATSILMLKTVFCEPLSIYFVFIDVILELTKL